MREARKVLMSLSGDEFGYQAAAIAVRIRAGRDFEPVFLMMAAR